DAAATPRPPFSPRAPRPIPRRGRPGGRRPPTDAGHRRSRRPRPLAGAIAPDPGGRPVPLPPPAGPPPLRRAGATGRLPRLRHGPRRRRPALVADPEAPRQGAAQPHQRLQLRRGAGPLRRAECPPQEVVRHRLLLSHRSRLPTPTAGGL